MTALLSVSAALSHILEQIQPVPFTQSPIKSALGLVSAEPIQADFDLPLFTNSSMDGFAVRSADIRLASNENPINLRVIGDIPAGTYFENPISENETARIMTGAPLPPGADAVVPVEETNFPYQDINTGLPQSVLIYTVVKPGGNTRPKGQDIHQGQLIFPIGRKLQPQDLGLLATLGLSKVLVHRQPKIAVISSGDELIPLGTPLKQGQIYESNGIVIENLIQQAGALPVQLGTAKDDPAHIREILQKAVDHQVDLIITSAGVSVGAFDFVKSVIEENGSLSLWRVNMRPGKPLAFGNYHGIPIISLPGNPVSAYVGFFVFVQPIIRKLMGLLEYQKPTFSARLLEPVESDGRESYLRAVVHLENAEYWASLTGHQGSGNLYSLVQANALIIIPAGVHHYPAGTTVKAWKLNDL